MEVHAQQSGGLKQEDCPDFEGSLLYIVSSRTKLHFSDSISTIVNINLKLYDRAIVAKLYGIKIKIDGLER